MPIGWSRPRLQFAARIDIARYGHARVIPVPANLYKISLQPPLNMRKQLQKQEHFQITTNA